MVEATTTESATSKSPFSTDGMHKVHLFTSKYPDTPISAYLPSTFTLSVSSDWGSPFDSGSELSSALGRLASVLGGGLRMQALTAQLWQGSSPVEFTLPLILIAESDAMEDVVLTVKRLMQMAMPDESRVGTMTPPGPVYVQYLRDKGAVSTLANHAMGLINLAGDFPGRSEIQGALVATRDFSEKAMSVLASHSSGGEYIDVFIGRVLHLRNVVIRSVTSSLAMQNLGHRGHPLRADVEVQFRTYTTLLKADLDRMFGLSSDAIKSVTVTGRKGAISTEALFGDAQTAGKEKDRLNISNSVREKFGDYL